MNNQSYNQQQPNRRYQQQPNRRYNEQKNNYSNHLPFQIGSSGNYMLYYSNFCINCKDFINILCKHPLYEQFIKINVSANKNYPPFVKSVPTILVPGITKPLVGREVFKWLENISKQESKQYSKEIIAYSPLEMSCSMGDNYSYLDVKDADQPMEHNFVFIKRGDQKIKTPSETAFIDTQPRRIKGGFDEKKRIPFPQGLQHKPQSNSSENIYRNNNMMPTMSNSSKKNNNIEDAYNDLLSRRKMDISMN